MDQGWTCAGSARLTPGGASDGDRGERMGLAGRAGPVARPLVWRRPATGRAASALGPRARLSSGPAASNAASKAGCSFAVRTLVLLP
ncbi:hypothetical protein G7087_06940 [Rubrivivax benzoatilyticus]|uniref:Uncharacterized protein n=1 Tax=Rubrivivax benzoatilyticus TaxID=316997 RepID=A0ABX0HXK2_9BURK|nr:hypothetical protein [Rubrivivax benzoatilyticus]NHL23611.1 hypothetical protein [Rubrivivax benzoatilyticus]